MNQCPGCDRTFDQLDVLFLACVHGERARSGDDDHTARLHVLAAVMSWWADRTLAQFPDRNEGAAAIGWCLLNVFDEQGFDLFRRGA